jgi:hypothetical protein
VKDAQEGAGFGGDWGVRLEAAQVPEPGGEDGDAGRRTRLSVILYIADAHWHTAELAILPDGSRPTLKEVGALQAMRVLRLV